MSETVGFTLPQIEGRGDLEPAPDPSPSQGVDPSPDPVSEPEPRPGTETTTDTFTKLSKSYRMTAQQIDQISHAKVVARRRMRSLVKSDTVTNALASVSTTKASLSWADTMASIDQAHSIRKEAARTLRVFELSNARLRDAQTLRLRTGKCWKRVYVDERRHVQRAIPGILRRLLSPGTMALVMHRQYCPVAIVDEFRTSRVCFYCFQEMQLVRSKRVKGQVIRTVRVHGAVECTNHDCVAVKGWYTIRPQDTHVLAVIGLSSTIPGLTFKSPTSTMMRGQPPTASGLILYYPQDKSPLLLKTGAGKSLTIFVDVP
ncbi:hypothetical protein KVV02_000726 [Mortierella alpina]|uniref:Uncharacterized protein n=1 Tax=Mortierella alpina TaxID=64518 RepID=A0A9P7ZXP1_MORAP|nr:hypothetical protein KVV02_000726 [Mortierella alpina]